MPGKRFTGVFLLLCSAATLACGPSPPYEPFPPGPTGYLSDRAAEVTVSVRGAVPAPSSRAEALCAGSRSGPPAWLEDGVAAQLAQVEGWLGVRGLPLPMDPAQTLMETLVQAGGERLQGAASYEVRAHGLLTARDLGIEARVAPLGERLDGATWRVPVEGGEAGLCEVRVSSMPAAALAPGRGPHLVRPAVEAFAADGVLEVIALFGQMSDDDALLPQDNGFWSMGRLSSALEAAGLERVRLEGGGERHTGAWGDVELRVELLPPSSLAARDSDDEKRAVIRRAISRGELVYLDAHARQPALDALSDPASYRPARTRLLVLDLCWSYHLYTRGALEAAAAESAPLQVLSSAKRVATGSVESFLVLLGRVANAAGGLDNDPTRASWISILAAMNDLAEARAEARRAEGVEKKLQPAELYGVSGL